MKVDLLRLSEYVSILGVLVLTFTLVVSPADISTEAQEGPFQPICDTTATLDGEHISSTGDVAPVGSEGPSQGCYDAEPTPGQTSYQTYFINQHGDISMSKIAIFYRHNGELARTFSSIEEASDMTDMSKTQIMDALEGYSESLAGFIWKYIPDVEV